MVCFSCTAASDLILQNFWFYCHINKRGIAQNFYYKFKKDKKWNTVHCLQHFILKKPIKNLGRGGLKLLYFLWCYIIVTEWIDEDSLGGSVQYGRASFRQEHRRPTWSASGSCSEHLEMSVRRLWLTRGTHAVHRESCDPGSGAVWVSCLVHQECSNTIV